MKLEVHKNLEEKMEKTIGVLKGEFSTLRTGRANPAILDKIRIDYYGTPTPLNQVGAVSSPDARTIMVQPWDMGVLKDIERAIGESDLGLNPTNDGKVIRIAIPALTEERRKGLVKQAGKMAEQAKVALRNERRDANDKLKKMQKDGEITEDDLKKAQDEVDKTIKKFEKTIEELLANKEKDILTV
jgi:ribosome recycling factor